LMMKETLNLEWKRIIILIISSYLSLVSMLYQSYLGQRLAQFESFFKTRTILRPIFGSKKCMALPDITS
jgi:hypothetical protein